MAIITIIIGIVVATLLIKFVSKLIGFAIGGLILILLGIFLFTAQPTTQETDVYQVDSYTVTDKTEVSAHSFTDPDNKVKLAATEIKNAPYKSYPGHVLVVSYTKHTFGGPEIISKYITYKTDVNSTLYK